MDHSPNCDTEKVENKSTLKSYILGLLFSVFLTMASYVLVSKHLLEGITLALTITGLGLIQMIVQLICFLYLDKEHKPRLNLLMFLFSALVVAILVFGSLWIMYSLSYRMMIKMPKMA